MADNFTKGLKQTAIIGAALLCAGAATRLVWVAAVYGRNIFTTGILVSLVLGLAYGIIRQHRWALRTAAGVAVLTAMILPVGLFNPFTAGDYIAAGLEPPSVGQTLLWFIPLEVLLLGIAYMLDPKKSTIDQRA